MKRLALGVAALLVATAGSVASATPGSGGGDWCEQNADAGARPEVEKERPFAAGGGSRDGRVPNVFACYDASAAVVDREVEVGAVVNAWADHENGTLRLSCVPQRGPVRRCNEAVTLPVKADVAPPSTTASAPTESTPARVTVEDQPAEPLLAAEVEGTRVSVDHTSVCVELDRTPLCRENPGGR
jgi:hypothetical protein